MTIWKPCIVRIREASATPMADSANASRNTNGTTSSTDWIVSFTPTIGASTSRIRPWIMACVAPPSDLPIATADRSIGATRTSLRNPNSRSHTIDIAPNTAENRTAIPMIPGNMNWM
jgi:hypothetical protein